MFHFLYSWRWTSTVEIIIYQYWCSQLRNVYYFVNLYCCSIADLLLALGPRPEHLLGDPSLEWASGGSGDSMGLESRLAFHLGPENAFFGCCKNAENALKCLATFLSIKSEENCIFMYKQNLLSYRKRKLLIKLTGYITNKVSRLSKSRWKSLKVVLVIQLIKSWFVIWRKLLSICLAYFFTLQRIQWWP